MSYIFMLVGFVAGLYCISILGNMLKEIISLLKAIIPMDCTTCAMGEEKTKWDEDPVCLDDPPCCDGCYAGPDYLAKEFNNWTAKKASGIKNPFPEKCTKGKKRIKNSRR